MYSLYVLVKYVLHWIVIMFKDFGNIICNIMSYTHCIMAKYKGTPYFCSFLIYLYDTCYPASSVMDIKHVS